MTPEEAQFLLAAYQRGQASDLDPQFQEALQLVSKNPELQAWLENEQAFDQSMRERLAETSIPTDLREKLLAGRLITPSRPWWGRSVVWAAAAVFLLAASSIFIWQRPGLLRSVSMAFSPTTAELFRKEMAEFMSEDWDHNLTNTESNVVQLKAWLQKQVEGEELQYSKILEQTPTYGCQVLNWHGIKVALVCFQANEGVIHVLTVPKSAIKDTLVSELAAAPVGEWSSVLWTAGDQLHLALATMPVEKLVAYL